MTLVDSVFLLFVFAQADITDNSDFIRTFLTAGVAGAALLAAIFGFIFFKPERVQLLDTIADLRATNEKYVEVHHNTTLPTLTKALSLFESVEATLTALTKASEDQSRTNTDVARRLELLERELESLQRRLQ